MSQVLGSFLLKYILLQITSLMTTGGYEVSFSTYSFCYAVTHSPTVCTKKPAQVLETPKRGLVLTENKTIYTVILYM